MTGTCIKNGRLQNTLLGYAVGTERKHGEFLAEAANKKLDGYCQIVKRDVKDMGTPGMKPKK